MMTPCSSSTRFRTRKGRHSESPKAPVRLEPHQTPRYGRDKGKATRGLTTKSLYPRSTTAPSPSTSATLRQVMEQLTYERLQDNLKRLKLFKAVEILDTVADSSEANGGSYLAFLDQLGKRK